MGGIFEVGRTGSVYEELIAFKDSMLDHADEASEELTAEAVADINVDRRLLRAQASRYRARCAFWRGRIAELEPASANGARRSSPPRLHLQDGPRLSSNEAQAAR